jgi:peroxiredoxin
MKKLHPMTTAGVGLACAAVALLFSGYPAIASALALVGYFFTGPEIPKFTSWYQFVMFPLQGIILGFTLDYGHDRFPFFTVALFLIPFAPLLRLLFYKSMLHAKFLWVEPPLVAAAIGLWIAGNLVDPQGWPGWFYPVPPIIFTLHLLISFLSEGIFFNRLAKQERETNVGSKAPDFELPDQNGHPVRLSDLEGKRVVLLLFLRGDWCPACHMMLRTYEKHRELLREKNVLLLAIGPDDIGINAQMAEKMGVEFRILADRKQEVSKAYGTHLQKDPNMSPLQPKHYEEGQPMPSTFLVCEDGIIRYRSRADQVGEFVRPEIIFEILGKLRTTEKTFYQN